MENLTTILNSYEIRHSKFQILIQKPFENWALAIYMGEKNLIYLLFSYRI